MLDSVIETLRDELPGWTLAFTLLQGVMGYCDPDRRIIWVDLTLSPRERSATIMHEIVHALWGHHSDDPALDHAVDVEAAKRLLPLKSVLTAIACSPHPEDMCDVLEVDPPTLRTRLQNLGGGEIGCVRRKLTVAVPDQHKRGRLCALGRWWDFHRLEGTNPCVTACDHTADLRAVRPAAELA